MVIAKKGIVIVVVSIFYITIGKTAERVRSYSLLTDFKKKEVSQFDQYVFNNNDY